MAGTKKTVRLTWELTEVVAALQAVAVLAENLANQQLENEQQERVALRGVGAVLALAIARLRLTCRVIRGDVPAGVLWAPHNDAPDRLLDDEQDVLLGEELEHRRRKRSRRR